jgi:hypothetical protein
MLFATLSVANILKDEKHNNKIRKLIPGLRVDVNFIDGLFAGCEVDKTGTEGNEKSKTRV